MSSICRACGNPMYVGLGVQPPKCDHCERKATASKPAPRAQHKRYYRGNNVVYTPGGVKIATCVDDENTESVEHFLNDVDKERRAERVRGIELAKAMKAVAHHQAGTKVGITKGAAKLLHAALKDFEEADPKNIPF